MFFDLLVPLIYLLLFGIGLDRAFMGGVVAYGTSVPYAAFFLAGVVSLANFGIAINTSYGFFVDRDNGIFYEFLTYPMTRGQLLVGKIVFNCLLSLVQGVLTLLLGVLVLQIEIEWSMLPLTLTAIVLATAGWFFALSIIALRVRRNDIFNTFFKCALFYPDVCKHALLSPRRCDRVVEGDLDGQSVDLAHGCAAVYNHRPWLAGNHHPGGGRVCGVSSDIVLDGGSYASFCYFEIDPGGR